MKSPIMLVCAMVAAMGMSVCAETQTNAAAAGGDAKAQAAAKGKHGQMTEAQREAKMQKRLEQIKAKDEALYKELVALKEKDPAAFKAKMRELAMADANKAKGKGLHKAGAEGAAK
jgi:hypothetical protein